MRQMPKGFCISCCRSRKIRNTEARLQNFMAERTQPVQRVVSENADCVNCSRP